MPRPWEQLNKSFLASHKADIHALKALFQGKATPEQQKFALDFIIEHICKTHVTSYVSDNTHDTAFAEGKRFVGNEIVGLVKIDTSTLRKKPSSLTR